jgi:ABC-type molybdenum transport system ATPase subunit/photorepair protein PhrA
MGRNGAGKSALLELLSSDEHLQKRLLTFIAGKDMIFVQKYIENTMDLNSTK